MPELTRHDESTRFALIIEDMRWFALALLASSPAASFAQTRSYELLLVVDATTKSVHRFDTASGAYFGSFGAGLLNAPTSIAVDKASGMAFVRDGNEVLGFDYSTGRHFLDIAVPTRAALGMATHGGKLLVAGGTLSSVLLYDIATGAALGSWATPGISRTDLVTVANNGYAYAYGEQSAGGSWCDAVDLSTGVATYVFSSSTTNIAHQGSALGSVFGYQWDPSSYARWTTLPGGPVAPASPFIVSFGSYLNAAGQKGMTAGHSDVYVSGRILSDPTRGTITRFNSLGTYRGQFGSTYLYDPVSMACVVAPEPASWAALALGGLALCKRRRR